MLDILLVITAILLGGACVGPWRQFAAGDSVLGWLGMAAFQQTFAAQSFRVGASPGGLWGCHGAAVAAALARPAPRSAVPSLHLVSGRGGGLR